MFGDGALTFREFAMHEPLPLATVHGAVLEFLRDADDAVLFGAQAVNAYVDEPRMTQDVDIASTRAAELAEELRERLSVRFHIAVRVREIGQGRGYRLYQIQKPKNRHLVDVRPVAALPPARRIGEVLVLRRRNYRRQAHRLSAPPGDAKIRDGLARFGRAALGVSRVEGEFRAGPRPPRGGRGWARGHRGMGEPG